MNDLNVRVHLEGAPAEWDLESLLAEAPVQTLLGDRVKVLEPDLNWEPLVFILDRPCRVCGRGPGAFHEWECRRQQEVFLEHWGQVEKAERRQKEAEEEAKRITTEGDVYRRFRELWEAVVEGGYDPRLGPENSPTRRVYGVILDRAMYLGDKVVIAGRQWLAGEAEVTEKAARYALKRLVDFGYLIRIKNWRRSPSKRAKVYMLNRNHEQQGRPPAMFRVRLDLPVWEIKDYQAESFRAKTRAKTGAKTRAI